MITQQSNANDLNEYHWIFTELDTIASVYYVHDTVDVDNLTYIDAPAHFFRLRMIIIKIERNLIETAWKNI